MRGWTRERKAFVCIYLLMAVAGVLGYAKASSDGAEAAHQNYVNSLASCRAGNPVREAVWLATNTAAEYADRGNLKYREAADKITAAPFVRPDGSRECGRAIVEP